MQAFDQLIEIMTQLRSPEGCPWDREQDHRSIRKYVIEEAYEVAEAIDEGSSAHLCAELGDLLLQVVFHAEMAREVGAFDIEDVCRGVTEKLRRRHPHVFGSTTVRDAAEVATNWEAIKARERGPSASAIDGVPRALPALQRAERLSEKAAKVGFDWPDAAAVLAKVDEERAELSQAIEGRQRDEIEHEIGDVLFTVANLARKLDLEPEQALQNALARFEVRFREVEGEARTGGESLAEMAPEELDRRWRAAKARVALLPGDR